ncbi:hypothetical protein B296_00012827 [Ensete ventricosum]|uniref:Uncharacterized protein n=1 Tax=Ensete ventricosum TaxID=4639 RepID=A0A427ACD3_ENSVE|nr:hypothetical protein B296_00012827 [Ensete ventricosum]
MEHRVEAQSFPLTKVKDINSHKGNSGSCCSMGLHSDGADSSCIVPKTKGALRHMHLILEMYLTGELSGDCANRGIEAQDPNNGAPILANLMAEEVLCDREEKGRRGEEKEEKGGKKKRKGEEEKEEKGKKGLQLWQLLLLGKKKGKEEEEGRGIREEEKGEKWKKGLQLWQLRLGKEEGGREEEKRRREEE